MTGCVGALGRGEDPSDRWIPENLFHFVPFCSILLVIVKFMASPGHMAQGMMGGVHEHAPPGVFLVLYVPFPLLL